MAHILKSVILGNDGIDCAAERYGIDNPTLKSKLADNTVSDYDYVFFKTKANNCDPSETG